MDGLEQNNAQNSGVFGSFEIKGAAVEEAGTIRTVETLPVKASFWNSFKGFWLQDIDWNKEIKIELTPYQQKVEDEINDFLHQEVTWKKIHNFLFQKVEF